MKLITQVKSYMIRIMGYIVVLVPDSSSTSAKSFKFSIRTIFPLMLVYTLFSALLGFFIINLTPLNNFLNYSKSRTNSESSNIQEMNSKIIFLTQELSKLKSSNEKLRYAIFLGDSSLVDSIKSDMEEKKQKDKNRFGGNIYYIVKEIFFTKIFSQESRSFIKPADGFISRGFLSSKGHVGIDFVLKEGTEIFASANGYVIYSNFNIEDGNMIIIAHRDGYITIYKHCSMLLKKERDNVIQGELIALSGNTGKITTGPHLHFEIWKDGIPLDPSKILLNL